MTSFAAGSSGASKKNNNIFVFNAVPLLCLTGQFRHHNIQKYEEQFFDHSYRMADENPSETFGILSLTFSETCFIVLITLPDIFSISSAETDTKRLASILSFGVLL